MRSAGRRQSTTCTKQSDPQVSERKRLRKLTNPELIAHGNAVAAEIARRSRPPKAVAALARDFAAGRVSRFEAFGKISSMAGADAFGPARGAA